MMRRFGLRDDQWERIKEVATPRPSQPLPQSTTLSFFDHAEFVARRLCVRAGLRADYRQGSGDPRAQSV
jgi:hypothetical protein